MTVKELSQYLHLKREIQLLQDEILTLEASAEPSAQVLSGVPGVGSSANKIADCACKAADLQKLLRERQEVCKQELLRLEQYIANVQDSQMRQILRLRYELGCKWHEIPQKLGLDGDGSTQRKQHNAFLKKFP